MHTDIAIETVRRTKVAVCSIIQTQSGLYTFLAFIETVYILLSESMRRTSAEKNEID